MRKKININYVSIDRFPALFTEYKLYFSSYLMTALQVAMDSVSATSSATYGDISPRATKFREVLKVINL